MDNISAPISLFKAYINISKPRLVILLYFTGLSSALIASSMYGYDWKILTLVSLAIITSVMGSNAATAYIDRDMDLVMTRTNKRPLPMGIITPPRNALIYGLVLVFAGIAISMFINYLTAVFIFLGFADSTILYNAVTKKRSPLNIILGSPAGGMPVLAGWSAVAHNRIDLIAVIMFILVIIWTPMHIWSLAYFYREDYKKAKVPMLPVIWSSKKIFILLSILNLILVFFSVFIGFYFSLSLVYIVVSIVMGTSIILLSIILLIRNARKMAWILFKLSSPYLAVIFLLLTIEYIWI